VSGFEDLKPPTDRTVILTCWLASGYASLL